MEAFKVTFNLKSPAVLSDDLYLDTLISAAKAKEILKAEYNLGCKAGEKELVKSTLNKLIASEYDVYKCSKLMFKEGQGNSFYVKRFEHKYENYIAKASKIDEQRGFFKAVYNPLSYLTDMHPTAICEGDMAEIERLLTTYIRFIGIKSSQGYGQIKNMQFEKTDKFSFVHNKKLVRNIPAKYEQEFANFDCEYDYAMLSVLPPYWRKEKELCIY